MGAATSQGMVSEEMITPRHFVFQLYGLRVWQNAHPIMGPSNERELAALVFLGILGVVIYRVILWLREATPTADPWGEEINQALKQDDALPLCPHCLTPQQHNGWFCPECGATVGQYCNYLPYVYLFSEGEVLRAGVTERIRRTPLIVIGYVLLPLSIFVIAAPVYWYFLFKNLQRRDDAEAEASPAGG
jgi:hypothetical protein